MFPARCWPTIEEVRLDERSPHPKLIERLQGNLGRTESDVERDSYQHGLTTKDWSPLHSGARF